MPVPAGPPRPNGQQPTATTWLVLGAVFGGLAAALSLAAIDTDAPPPMPPVSAPVVTYPTWPAVLTMRLEPTATVEPTPTVVSLPTATPRPIVYCDAGLSVGETCTWPPAPPPAPTPYPICGTPAPGETCRVERPPAGSPATPIG